MNNPKDVVYNPDKKQLEDRLYDQGFSHYTLPSVARPKNALSQGKPLVARLYSLNNNLIKEVKQPQTSILFNNPDQANITPIEFEKSKNQKLITKLSDQNFIGQDQNNIQKSESDKQNLAPIGIEKKPIQINSELKPIISKGSKVFQPILEANNDIAGIEPRELKQVNLVLNKLRESYLERTKFYNNQPINVEDTSKTRLSKITPQDVIGMKKDQSISTGKIEPTVQYIRKGQMELDLYINLIMKNSPNIDEFVYLMRNPESDDPYDLILKNYFQIQNHGRKGKKLGIKNKAQNDVNVKTQAQEKKEEKKNEEYYTISIKGLCHFKDGKPVEFIGLVEWLKERETYDKIKNLAFFANFRKWKTLKMWSKNYKSFKQKVAKKSLQKKLLINYPELREAILQSRETLYNMANLKFLDLNVVRENQNEASDIDRFIHRQENKAQQTHVMIQSFSKEIHQIVNTAIESRLEIFRSQISQNSETDNFKKTTNGPANENAQIYGVSENPYEALSFPENMSYDKRSILRKECYRFVRFSYFSDFLAQDALRSIYLRSLKVFVEEIEDLTLQSDPVILRELEKGKQTTFKDPMFQLQVISNLNYDQHSEELIIEEEEVSDYKFPQIGEEELGPEAFMDYHILTYPFLINYDVIEDFNEHQKKFCEYCEPRTFIKKKVTNIESVSLELSPSIQTLKESINKILTNGLESLQAFESFVQHPNMKKYSAVLEEWEEKEDNRHVEFENTLLNPEDCIDPDEKIAIEKSIKYLFEGQFKKAKEYLIEFRQFLQSDWEYKRLDVSLLVNLKLAKPGLTFNAIFNVLEYQKVNFEVQIPFQADIGMFRVMSRNLKLELLGKPKLLKDKIGGLLSEEIQSRVLVLKNWFDENIQKLKLNTTDIEIFVKQSKNLKNVELNIGYYKDFLKTTKEVIETIRKFQIEIKKEYTGMFTDCKNLEQYLANQLVQVNDNIVKNQEIFSRDIKENSITSLLKDCAVMEEKLSDVKYWNINSVNVLPELETFERRIEEAKQKAKKLNQFEEVLGLSQTKFKLISGLEEMVTIRILLWQSFKEWFEIVESWRQSRFNEIKVEEIQTIVEKYQKNLSKCRKHIPPGNEIVSKLDTDIKNFSSMLPIVIALRNPKFKPSHLQEIQNETKISFNLEELRLQDLLKEEILEQQQIIMNISIQVTQEVNLKLQLNEIEDRFNGLSFPIKNFKEDSPKDSTYILGDVEPLLAEIDRLIMMINSVYGSRYLKEHKKIAHDKRKDILTLQDMLIEWIKFQKSYVYLESIFSQAEIKKPLQMEVKEFEDSVNKVYKQNAKKIATVASISSLTKSKYIDQYLTIFKKHNEILHELNKKLNNFLDSKREAFPRFYFVSNDELVFILANNDSSSAVQTFMSKLFENVHKVDFGQDPRSITIFGLISREGEVLQLKIPVSIKGDSVEKWMKKLEDCMFDSVFRSIKEGFQSYAEYSRNDWYVRTSAQGLSVISQLAWTLSIEDVLKNLEKDEEENTDMGDVLNDTQKNLEILTTLVREKLPSHQRQALVAIITTEVHNRDVIELIIQKNVSSRSDFIWQQQLRCYFEEGSDFRTSINIMQINAKQKYGFEYYGPCSRIVITPLTERCWMTITSALQMSLGAAPAGPAGTGKTESVKDLAKSLARFCLVFNCSDQIDYLMMEKLFRGIIKQGAWTCLDEFNRIDIEVLSVVAQQLLELRIALLTKKNDEEFFFCGARCRLSDTCGVFITMNPGYAGRTELPENLKSLFRPIAMMIPDYTLISQILLFSEGFLDSKNLASKMIKLYKLASEQLSQQRHYDFGMRAVKCVLEMSGKLKRKNPNESEQTLLIKALKDANLPKFLKDDVPLFNALLNDLFPNMQVKENDEPELLNEIHKQLNDNFLQTIPAFDQKLLQLHSTLNVRFGTMVVGNALNGKTVLINTLKDAINSLIETADKQVAANYSPVNSVVINPKSVTMGELYGEENILTKDWADGIASFYLRQATNSTDKEQKWICFDGPVDSLWIENMNSVLDDSRILCLANGQRIRLKQEMRILFEVDILDEASPATISRCGMVYISEQILGWQSLVKSWVRKIGEKKNNDGVLYISQDIKIVLENLFLNNLDSIIDQVKSSPKPIDMPIFQYIRSTLNYLEIYLTEDFGFKLNGTDEYKSRYIVVCFVMALAWGFAGCLQDRDADKIDNLIKKKFPTYNFPTDLLVNCYIDTESLEFKLYADILDSFSTDLYVPFWEILIPTVDTVKISSTANWLLKSKRHVFLTGSTGTGKSVLAANIVQTLVQKSSFDAFKYNFSAQTNSKDLQESLMSSLFLLSQKSRGARFGKQNLIIIDDVNMPAREQYGAQPPIELLRQFVDKSYVYDRKEMNKITIQDTLLFCLGAPPEGGRNPLSKRFVRHFDMLCIPKPRSQTIVHIFNTIMNNFLQDFDESVKQISKSIVSSSLELYEKIIAEKLPLPSKFFYTFNLRDLSKTFMGVMKANKSVVKEGKQLARLWIHETYRVFSDRLTSSEDRDWFNSSIKAIAEGSLGMKGEDVVFQKIVFTDLFTITEEEIIYEEVIDQKLLIKKLEEGNDEYNEQSNTKMQLVFFEDTVSHLLRTYRILRQSRGNAMLIGVGGLGKTSITKMASFLTDYAIISIEQAKGCIGEKFKEWLRKSVLLKCAGPDADIMGRSVTLLVSEGFIKDELIFEDINNLLNTGEIPNIFPKDEREKLEKGLIDMYMEHQVVLEPADVWKTFIERVRDNLHIVMCMSPIGNALRVRCRRFPALVDCTTIDWFDNWPGEAISSVAEKLIECKNFSNQRQLAELFRTFHELAHEQAELFVKDTKRKFFITPKLTLDNISLFMSLYQSKSDHLKKSKAIFEKGSVKLIEMSEFVKVLKVQLTEAQPLLEEQKILTDQKLIELEASSSIANEKKEKVEHETNIIQVKTEQIELINNQAMAQLNESMPMIIKAEQEVRNIDKKELSTLRHLTTPPAMIEFIFSTVCLVLDEKYISWRQTGIKLLNDLNKFIEMLIDKIDKIKTVGSSVVNAQVINALAKNLKNEFFSDLKLDTNVIAKPLGIWCKAVYEFTMLKKQIEPLEKNAKEMSEKLSESKKEYEIIAAELAVCKENFQKLQNDFNSMESKKKVLETTIEQTKIKLNRAQKLTSLLSDEGERWKQTIVQLEVDETNLLGDIFLSSAFISYMCPLTNQYREQLIKNWCVSLDGQIKFTIGYKFINIMGDSLVLKDWCAGGLPSDVVSQSSALAATLSNKWPFFIDPQMQANIWIKKSFAHNLIILSRELEQKVIIEKLKLALCNGFVVLFEDMKESLDSILDSMLNHCEYINTADQRHLIHFNDDDVDYNPEFRLFMSTKISNPNLTPEAFIKSNVINFTVNMKGLEDQLLAEVMKLENPEVENTKNENIEKIGGLKKKMIEIEKQILVMLAECQKSPVEDENLVQTLEVSKITVTEIKEKMAQVDQIFQTIDATRNSYRFLATRGSVLYYVTSDIVQIDSMYQYSLQYIIKLFKIAIINTKETDIDLRKNELLENITKIIFNNVSRGLFEHHKSIFSFLITVNLQIANNTLQFAKLELFLKGAGIIDKKNKPPSPDIKIISENAWDLVLVLAEQFPETWGIILSDLIENFATWKSLAKVEDIINFELPSKFEEMMIAFDRLLLVKIFRPEKLFHSISSFIRNTMGTFYSDGVKWDMENVYNDSDCFTPIIFIISQGSDPSSMVKNLGSKKGFEIYQKLTPISLGQGQGKRAAALIAKGIQEGTWVLLENCHLAKTWMQELEIIIQDIQSQKKEIHADFRLFITSMPASYFSVSILQNGIKVTTEPPRGVRANVIRAVNSLSESYFDNFEYKTAITKLTIGLCMFHAILRERRKYGPLGWNILYEFNDSDIEAAKDIHLMFLKEVTKKDDIPWESITLLVGQITYGGRITDDLDRRLLMTILNKFYTDQILDDRYKYCCLEEFRIPKLIDVQSCLTFAESLPAIDDTEVFGFHKNANLSFQTSESSKILDTILSVMPKNSSSSGGEDTSISKVKDLIAVFLGANGLPSQINIEKGNKDLFTIQPNGLIPSLSTVLLQEIYRYNKLLNKILTSLTDLNLAVQGKSVMSAELDDLFNFIIINKVPQMWTDFAYPSLKPLASWFKDLCARVAFINNWLNEGFPKFYWLSGFFFPQGFLTGVLQTHARKLSLPIDKFCFTFKVSDFEATSANIDQLEDGIYVSGLFLEGASWDKKRRLLVDQQPNDLYNAMPLIAFIPRESQDIKGNYYSCPLYKTLNRAGALSTTGQSQNFILEVLLPCDKQSEFWILRGSALFTQLNS